MSAIIRSSKSSTPSPVLADILRTEPGSQFKSLVISVTVLSTSAPGASILLTAPIMVKPCSLAASSTDRV